MIKVSRIEFTGPVNCGVGLGFQKPDDNIFRTQTLDVEIDSTATLLASAYQSYAETCEGDAEKCAENNLLEKLLTAMKPIANQTKSDELKRDSIEPNYKFWWDLVIDEARDVMKHAPENWK